MNRRSFLTQTGIAGTAAIIGSCKGADPAGADYYELRQYHLDTAEQQNGLGQFVKEALIPAVNRIGIKPVGVFKSAGKISPVYVLLRHNTVKSAMTMSQKLLADTEFMDHGESFLQAPAATPSYQRMECSFMTAFKGLPQMEMPVTSEGRVFQLRVYESPSIITGQKKIEMFNNGEIDIFRKTGLNPVFFGETIIGSKMPNLTYMLVFSSMEEQKASWKRFIEDPDWKKLKAIPEYADKKILSNITNIILVPMECSQI